MMKTTSLAIFVTLAVTSQSFAANLLVNPGFEDPINVGPSFVGSWTGFSQAGGTAANSSDMPRSGGQSLRLDIDDTLDTFAGAFQAVEGLIAGDEFTFAGWHASNSDLGGVAVDLRIEWLNSAAENDIISQTPNSAPALTSVYSMFSLTATVPSGVDLARVVYAIQTFDASGGGTVFVDDTSAMSTSAVPDGGGSLCLLLAGVSGLGALRKRLRQ